ncbi:MAG: hypothetical protein AB7O26_11585 [Planctomycetaceae bacterium]
MIAPFQLQLLQQLSFQARGEQCRRRARCGDPFPLVELQWPELRIREEEREFFSGGLRIDTFQADIIQTAFQSDITEVFIKGCTRPGKGFAVAIVANIWFDVFPESRVILCSDRIEHARTVMFAEIAALRARMQHPGRGRIQVQGVTDSPKHYMTIANPQTGEGFSGQHGAHTLFIFDEASAVPEELYENAKKQARLIIALSNPRTMSGWFRRAFPADSPDETQSILTTFGRRRCVTVGGSNCLNVRHQRLEKPFAPLGGIEICGEQFEQGRRIPDALLPAVRPIIPNQLDYARYRDIIAHPDPHKRAVYGEGRFPTEDAQLQVILGSWLKRHEEAWRQFGSAIPVEAFGLDVAASLLGDETILAAGGSAGLRNLHALREADTMQTVAWVLALARDRYDIDLTEGDVPVAVDMDGLGKGVGDRLKEQGVQIVEIRGGRAADIEPNTYANKRAENYGELARRLDPAGPWGLEPWPVCPDPLLRAELVAHEKIYGSDGLKFRLTPKDRQPGGTFKGETLREKLGRSPDRADAVTYLYAAVRGAHDDGPVTLARSLLLVTPEEQSEFRARECDGAQELERIFNSRSGPTEWSNAFDPIESGIFP